MKKTINSLFLVVGLLATAHAWGAASSKVVWNLETRNLLRHADPAAGQKLSESCQACHGKNGSAQVAFNFPLLSGQVAAATFKQLVDYRDNNRSHGIMQNFASALDRKQIADLAVWYQSQALPVAKTKDTKGKPFQVTERARKLVFEGDGERLIPPCAACHGRKGQGAVVDVPALAGQNPSYFTNTMYEFKTGRRANDIYSRMRLIAESLSYEEIDELANYYGSIGVRSGD